MSDEFKTICVKVDKDGNVVEVSYPTIKHDVVQLLYKAIDLVVACRDEGTSV